MTALHEHGEARLTIEIEPDFRKRVEAAAVAQGVSLRDYVVAALHEALHHPPTARSATSAREWSRLSDPAFSRDWDSDADAIYDDLA